MYKDAVRPKISRSIAVSKIIKTVLSDKAKKNVSSASETKTKQDEQDVLDFNVKANLVIMIYQLS